MNFQKICVHTGSLLAMIIAVFGLLAYIPGWRLLGSVRPGYIPMAPSTAAAFILMGAILMGKTAIARQRRAGIISSLLVLAATVFGFLEFAGYLLGANLNLEGSVIPNFGRLGAVPIARMSPSTGLFFFFAGVSLLLLLADNIPRDKRAIAHDSAGLAGLLVLVGSLTFILGYLYGTPLMYNSRTIPMALTTAMGFLFLGTGLIAAVGRDHFPIKQFYGPSTYARLMRVFFPLCMVAVLAQNIMTRFLPVFENVNNALSAAVTAILFAGITAIFIDLVAKNIGNEIDRVDNERQKAEMALRESHEKYRGLFNSIRDPILVTDMDRRIIDVNPAFTALFGYSLADLAGKQTVWIYKSAEQYEALGKTIKENFDRDILFSIIAYRKKSGAVFPGETGVYFLKDRDNTVTGFIGVIRDITERTRIEAEKERLIHDLQQALSEVKTLSGLLPICSSCKKIRDDSGYWQQIEGYIHEHSDAQFTHGLCPECARRLYPDIDLSETV